ncbi:MAG: type I restriction enzyme HsdR N-terminal domain-containing protein [Candidatus Moeniiplasma glomeromycotorum]|nr:type I restriction enzyme HsdR N-terminal domain-containing protein [Candidatus Moeniiplasma glomeromycotorum]MCE8167088.1 type I restriction enzyme HsdR N-terminal domain-containing protein [Candidatus Moeniiplasma glomeromycotorum]MCE8168900.1 type I restriction enzyme HsdR N-terminal domain-containing protein [Candidatus Moeniiplasma glomeromycotorum]
MLNNPILFLKNHWFSIALGSLFLLLLFFLIVFWPTEEKKPEGRFIFCPLRQKHFLKHDSQGQFTEEFQRIRLINYFLKKGYSRSALRLEYPIEKYFGHKGQSKVKILVDLVVWREGKFWVVAEVKKSYRWEWKKSALEHQLKPAMDWTKSKYGIYWDGSEKSCCLVREEDGSLRMERFPV